MAAIKENQPSGLRKPICCQQMRFKATYTNCHYKHPIKRGKPSEIMSNRLSPWRILTTITCTTYALVLALNLYVCQRMTRPKTGLKSICLTQPQNGSGIRTCRPTYVLQQTVRTHRKRASIFLYTLFVHGLPTHRPRATSPMYGAAPALVAPPKAASNAAAKRRELLGMNQHAIDRVHKQGAIVLGLS